MHLVYPLTLQQPRIVTETKSYHHNYSNIKNSSKSFIGRPLYDNRTTALGPHKCYIYASYIHATHLNKPEDKVKDIHWSKTKKHLKCDIQTHRTGHTDWETGGSRMVCLPDFQMNHGDSGIFNLTYRLDATN